MSNIPSTAISNALTPVQRQANDSISARRAQAQKNLHRTEDVEELDDTAVDSVHDQAQRKSEQDFEEEKDLGQPEENLDLKSLETPPTKPLPKSDGLAHLDISA